MTTQIQSQYRSFTLQKSSYLKEIHATLTEWQHTPTGAIIMHIANDDPENVFCLSFRTLPRTSNGVAHILEHTTLCGSEKYPVKDPFFCMTRRSLHTFMNAFTGSDFTCYPAASQVPKDFYNLLSVYLDAVFFPDLHFLSFRQEGHRLEFEEENNPKSPLKIKGIVFNEMKGSMASPATRLYQEMLESLYPDTTYGVNSGGDPKEIPNLSYEELLEFYREYYHPSRCLFYFYGNIPIENHLDYLEDELLHNVTPAPPLQGVEIQQRRMQHEKKIVGYPCKEKEEKEIEDKSLVGFGWLTCDALDSQEVLALNVLDLILMRTDASPLKHALLNSGLCKQAGSILDTDNQDVPFALLLKGCKKEEIDLLETLIFDQLKILSEMEISNKDIERAIHQIELERLEITGDGLPYGLSLFLRSGLHRQKGGDPKDYLCVHSLFSKLRQAASHPDYFSNLIKKHFLENSHFSRILLVPDPLQEAQEQEEEDELLKHLYSQLDTKAKKSLIAQAQMLQKLQEEESQQDLDVLPKISLKDVPKSAKNYLLEHFEHNECSIYFHETFTNHILYADLSFDLPSIQEEDLPYLSLLTLLITEIGSGGRTYEETLDYAEEHTGGVEASVSLHLPITGVQHYTPSISLFSKCLNHKIPQMFSLLRDTITSPNFCNPERIRNILIQKHTEIESKLQHSPLQTAMLLASSHLSSYHKLNNLLFGLDFFKQLKKWVTNFDEHVEIIIEKLSNLSSLVFQHAKPDLILSGDRDHLKQLENEQWFGLTSLPFSPSTEWSSNIQYSPLGNPKGCIIASPVAFTAEALGIDLTYTSPEAPAISLATHLMENITLHKRIREQGGAYGCGSAINLHSGTFYFYSYRDPHLIRTLAAFREALESLTKTPPSQEKLEEAKLELVQSADQPVAPGARGIKAYQWLREGKTLEIRQSFRDQFLSASPEQVQNALKKQLLKKFDQATTVSFANQLFLEKENEKLQEADLPLLELSQI